MKKKIVIIALLIALLTAGGTVAYRKFFTTPETRVLETGRVERGDIRGVLVGTGIIKSQVGAVVKRPRDRQGHRAAEDRPPGGKGHPRPDHTHLPGEDLHGHDRQDLPPAGRQREHRLLSLLREGLQGGRPPPPAGNDIIKFLVALTGSLIAFVGIVGIISLAVAGFVLANLFHLSIRERRGEIGMAAGFLMSLAIARILGYPVSVSVIGLLTAFAASVASGVLAGIYPSLKATTIHPVDIIRS